MNNLRITTILKKYISERIPQKATNIFWQMFNGINAMFTALEYRLDIVKRERNMLTAQQNSSLRHMAAMNGFEPVLKIPSKGLLKVQIESKLFNRVGYPLFLPPYAVFTNKLTKLKYYYNSDKSLRIADNSLLIPVIEGEVKTVTEYNTTGQTIERIYLSDGNIAEGSISVEINGVVFQQVDTFFGNNGVNDNKQFVIKFSSDIQNPIIVYIKGSMYKDQINIVYRLTSGEVGNLNGGIYEFETEDILDNLGSLVDIGDDEITIVNLSGFDFGSNGTDQNALRAAIGYNHSIPLLYDNQSYRAFIAKFSTVLIQDIKLDARQKTINNIWLSKRQALNSTMVNIEDFISQYKNIINTKAYYLTTNEKKNLSKFIEENEFCMTSHNIFDANINHFAFQIKFDNNTELEMYSGLIKELIYKEFAYFLYIRDHKFNVDNSFEQFMLKYNIKFDYIVFNQIIEAKKISEKSNADTPYIIDSKEYLPLLKGDFNISDSDFSPVKLFFDVNIVSL